MVNLKLACGLADGREAYGQLVKRFPQVPPSRCASHLVIDSNLSRPTGLRVHEDVNSINVETSNIKLSYIRRGLSPITAYPAPLPARRHPPRCSGHAARSSTARGTARRTSSRQTRAMKCLKGARDSQVRGAESQRSPRFEHSTRATRPKARHARQSAEHRRSADVGHRVPYRIPQMRASHLALIVAVLAIPSTAYSQESGQVDGRVGPDLNTSLMQPNPSPGSMGPYHRPAEPGLRAGGGCHARPGGARQCARDSETGSWRHRLRRWTPCDSWTELESHLASGSLN
jgi:hypothetical protein